LPPGSLFDSLSDEDHSGDEPSPMSVSRITAEIRDLLQAAFPSVWVEGEISNLARPRSGHVYFTLKDSRAQLPAVLWRSAARALRCELKDGMAVICRGKVDVYPPHGRYQMIVEQLEPVGLGALERAFRRLHAKLQKEGLFEPHLKKPLPRFLRRVAVVTSPTGAAVRDFLQVLSRRWPGMEVWIIPVKVQGEGAADQIARAIAALNAYQQKAEVEGEKPIDAIVLTRGGGSLEDLWAFNEEATVRAVAASDIPIVSAVGHEIDISLCDLAADLRALTPTEAAQRIAPETQELRASLAQWTSRLEQAFQSGMRRRRDSLTSLARSAIFLRPVDQIVHARAKTVDHLEAELERALDRDRERRESKIGLLAGRLESLSPLRVLERGYSVTSDDAGRLVRSVETVRPAAELLTCVQDGTITSRVENIERSGIVPSDGRNEGKESP
jgi:exodeoxyribonuclease VII large subunit